VNKFENHRNYLDAVNLKYHNSIMANFGGLQLSNNNALDNPSSNPLKCRHCGYSSKDFSDLNDHLVIHRNDIPNLSRSEWKETLFELVELYQEQLQNINLSNLQSQSNQIGDAYIQNIANHNQLISTLISPKSDAIIPADRSTPYPNSLSVEAVLQFKENECVDYRDFNGRYLKAKINEIGTGKSNEIKFGIHYLHWADKWNTWSVPRYQSLRFNHFGVISQRGLHRDEMRYVSMEKPFGDIVEIRPLHLHRHTLFKQEHQPNDIDADKGEYRDEYLKWCIAEICLKDKFSAQVQAILYVQNENEENGEWFKPTPKADLYWVHLDNEQECAPIDTHIKNPIIAKKSRARKRKSDHSSTPNSKKQRYS